MADHEEAVMSENEERIPTAPVDLAAAERYLARARDLREALGIPASAAIDARALAAGEHNMNFVFAHPSTGERFVLPSAARARSSWKAPRATSSTHSGSCCRAAARPSRTGWTTAPRRPAGASS